MPDALSTIVAATDFSFAAHRAARRAGLLARAHGAALELLHVIDEGAMKSLLNSAPSDMQARLHAEAKRSLASLSEDVAKATGMVASTALREGRVADELRTACARSDLAVLGARGVNPLRDLLLGSTAERITRSIRCPILVVKQDPQVPYHQVLVPVDFSSSSAAALQFAARVAPQATLHVFHTFDDSVEGMMRNAGVSDDAIGSYHQSLARDAKAKIAELTVGFPANTVKLAEAGDARMVIARRAAELGCTLIVMGKQGRSWLGDQLLGSVTRHVLERAECDVVVVPPT